MGLYASKADLRNVFGTENVRKWSNLDGTTTSDDDARIAAAITAAESDLHDRLRDAAYALPLAFLDSDSSARVTYWIAVKAGLALFRPRQIASTGDKKEGSSLNALEARIDKEINELLSGVRRLNARRNFDTASGPVIVT